MISKSALIYLDFDGVIADSAVECIDTAFIAMNKLQQKLVNEPINLKQSGKLKDLAIAYRYLVLPPEHFYCLIRSIQIFADQIEPNPDEIVDRFYHEISQADKTLLDHFRMLFFASREREAMRKTDKDWYLDNPATPFIKSLKPLISQQNVQIEIVSRKDERSLLRWISGGPYDFDCVYGNEALARYKNEKFSLISKLQERNGYKAAIFVDDAVGELSEFDWKSVGVTPLIAGWGYNDLIDNSLETLNYIKEWIDDISD